MKRNRRYFKCLPILLACMMALTACGSNGNGQGVESSTENPQESSAPIQYDGVMIALSNDGITVDGAAISRDESSAVYMANDIVYYEEGKDFTYGEGTAQDAHSKTEADAHTVVHIAKAGTYVLSGTLSQGQIAVDLGDDAKEDPEAVVTLVLNGVDITCEVAPAVIFYNVYECSDDDADKATKDVNTSTAGANVIIADGTTNTVHGAYVARIYKPDSVVLNEAGTEVEDAKKLHKYDAAFYSRKSMNVDGGPAGTGTLTIYAENEGLDSELHLTINGGNIAIYSGNDGINTNEDGVSVTTINGGVLQIRVTGETGEGDGIDSNGWLVINGGTVIAEACSRSADAGVDSDMGIHVNGGMLIATGHMLDQIENGGQTYAVFNFAQTQSGGQNVLLRDSEGSVVMECAPQNNYSIMILSSPDLKEGTYTFWSGETQLAGQSSGMMGGFGMPGGMGGQMPEMPEGFEGQMPESWIPGEMPESFTGEVPNGTQQPQEGERPNGNRPEGFDGTQGHPGNGQGITQEVSAEFLIRSGGNMFSNVSPWQ